MGRLMPPRWQHNSFLILLPSQEELTVIQKQQTTQRPLEHGDEAKAPSCPTETKPDGLWGVRGESSPDQTWSLPQASTAPRKEVSPLSLQVLQWETGTQGGQPVLPPTWRVALWKVLLWSFSAGESVRFNHWESDHEWREEGFATCTWHTQFITSMSV